MNTELVMTVKEIDADRSRWLEERKKGIGGSDAGVILGVSPWETPYSLWALKTGLIESEDKAKDNEAIYWGSVLEETVAAEFTKRSGKKVKKMGMVRNKKYPWLIADLDRIVVGENAGLECKTGAHFESKKWENDSIPDTYYCQVLHYMLVCDLERFYIAALLGGQKYIYKCIERKDVQADIDALFEAEKKFWEENVLGNKAPELDGSEKCAKALSKQFQRNEEIEMDLDAEANLLCADIVEMEKQVKLIENQIELKKNTLKNIMGGHEFGYAPDFKVSWTFIERKSLDSKKVIKEIPSVANNERYIKVIQSRRFTITSAEKEN